MAKNKNSGFSFKDFVKQLEETKVQPTEVEVKQERKYFLIVSEGERTEPIYFEYLSTQLPKNLLRTIEVHGEGDNTINVVNKAIELRDERIANHQLPNYDEVWAVFDKDDFPAERYNGAIQLAANSGIESGHSNQSFELWYVLHFQFLQNALHRDDYIKILTKQLKFKYAKNTPKVIEKIARTGNEDQAILWAEELERMHEGVPPAEACPHTRVYELVKRLRVYMKGKTENEED
ncbi:RloB-like protein [Mucilaginibacter gracilis]|uniref:RloB-like protein n=1 Tax=Mucilaginibacter gracilis TaxID=423350 RepID=A0A495J1S7_9SPHI|nr:RloB family protein [Mucilaginibacter gracilis]RKR82915.1 RloB-like protein [Mucilaginibacter gracilis]